MKGCNMITREKIRKSCMSTTFLRGIDVYGSKKIKDFNLIESEIDSIEAEVKGSGRNTYSVKISYDTHEDKVISEYCDCPAYHSYNGLCKHCVAVLLKYIDVKVANNSIADKTGNSVKIEQKNIDLHYSKQLDKSNHQPLRNDLKSKPKLPDNTRKTSPLMKQLLDKQFVKKAVPMMQGDIYGKVRFQPILVCHSEGIYIEFKIGITHMYILKDVFEFARNLEGNQEYEYGKKLKFIHVINAFAEEDQSLVEFVQNWTSRNKERFMQMSYHNYSYGYIQQKLRTIPLDTRDLEEFLDIMGDRSFTANVNETGEMQWVVTDKELTRSLQITGKNNGLEVKTNKSFGYECIRDYIYFDGGFIHRIGRKELEPISDFVQCMRNMPKQTAFIHKEDIPQFCRELLPTLERFYVCTKNNFNENDYGIVPVTFEIYLDSPQTDYITCKLIAVYGEKKYNVFGTVSDANIRDLIREMEVGQQVSKYFSAFDENEKVMVIADDEEKLYDLLFDGITQLKELGEIYISDSLRRVNVKEAPSIAVGVELTGDLINLRLTAGQMSQEELVEILSKYNKKKKYYRLKNGDFVSVNDEGMGALIEMKEGLGLTEHQIAKGEISIPKYRALYLDSELQENKLLTAAKNKTFKALLRNMKTVEDNDFEVPKSLESILREYQKRGFLWIKTLEYNGFGGILADDMGLGKTLQVITFLLSQYLDSTNNENRRCLIVSPASLVYNWYSEIEKFAPELPVKMVVGSISERKEIIEHSDTKDILLTSYDLLKRDLENYEGISFAYEIIDEAQYIKNHGTRAAKAVKAINAKCRLALTGTPIENRLSELWSIFDYLMPGFLYSYNKFREEIEIPIVQNKDQKVLDRLQKMIRPFVLRRLKRDVLKDLPDKLEENMYAKLEGEQQKLYDAHVQRMKLLLDKQTDEEFRNSKIQVLSELTRLRQICCEPALVYENYEANSAKADMCMDLIQNAINGGHKILLFSQFTSMLDTLQKRMDKEHISYYSLTGSTSKEKRRELVEAFNRDDTSVFCISLKAGGTGLNLTSADIVIHYDPWWNLAVQNQATDRAHRIGQKSVVNVYKLILKGTIEDKIVKLQEKKLELADQVLSGAGMDSGSFNRSELLELLS